MNRHALIAFGAVVIIAAVGAYALQSIDKDKGEPSAVAFGKTPATISVQQAETPPTPRVAENNPPPPAPNFEAQQPVPSVLCGTYLTVPPRAMHTEQGCKDELNSGVPQGR